MCSQVEENLSPSEERTLLSQEEDAEGCSLPESSPAVQLVSKMNKNPLVFAEKVKIVLYTHHTKLIKINHVINLDLFCL